MNFKEWFESKLKVSRFPLPYEIEKSDFDIYINVSDEYISSCHLSVNQSGKMYFWFPLNECTSDIGLNSIYACMQIMYNAELESKKVYLHCHAGVNRSPTIKECYYLMRSGNLLELKNSRLEQNILNGNLPSLNKLKRFLFETQNVLKKEETMRGGCLDSCKLKSEL